LTNYVKKFENFLKRVMLGVMVEYAVEHKASQNKLHKSSTRS